METVCAPMVAFVSQKVGNKTFIVGKIIKKRNVCNFVSAGVVKIYYKTKSGKTANG